MALLQLAEFTVGVLVVGAGVWLGECARSLFREHTWSIAVLCSGAALTSAGLGILAMALALLS